MRAQVRLYCFLQGALSSHLQSYRMGTVVAGKGGSVGGWERFGSDARAVAVKSVYNRTSSHFQARFL